VTAEARLARVERQILAALRSGPKTLGQLLNYHLVHVHAAVRDEAVAGLLKARRVRLTTVAHPYRYEHRPLPAIELAEVADA
jgi:hypothetical protein